jgi:UDP-N-acetylmuramyl pentapeptide phosphotransferase/UDP-N-acetylglucosamine-1-phosphate transferase
MTMGNLVAGAILIVVLAVIGGGLGFVAWNQQIGIAQAEASVAQEP